MDYSAGGLFLHPGRLERGDLLVDRTVRIVRAWQVTRGHEELVDDLATREDESLSEELGPLLFCEGMMRVQPASEGTEFLLQLQNRPRVDDGRIDLQLVADNARVRQQTGAVLLRILRDLFNVKAMIGFMKMIGLLEDRDPRQTSLVDLEHKPLEEQVVIFERKSILGIVISRVEGIFGVGVAVITVRGHEDILLSSRYSVIVESM